MPSRDDIDLEATRAELLKRRAGVAGRVETFAAPQERGAAQGFGKRIGDGTVEAISRLTEIGVGQTLEGTLLKIDRALAKLDDGTYGRCDQCGGEIPAGRLNALPESVLCMRCASAAPRPAPPRR